MGPWVHPRPARLGVSSAPLLSCLTKPALQNSPSHSGPAKRPDHLGHQGAPSDATCAWDRNTKQRDLAGHRGGSAH